MSQHFQDWEPVVFRKKQPAKPSDPQALKEALRKGHDHFETKTKISDQAMAYAAKLRKLEADTMVGGEAVTMKLPCLDLANRQEMLRARTAKGLSQAQLAQQLNVRASVIHDMESGKPIMNHELLVKLNRVLGTHLKASK